MACGLLVSSAGLSGCGDAGNNYSMTENGERSHYIHPNALEAPGDLPPLSYGKRNRVARVTPDQLASIAEAAPGVETAVVLMNQNDVAVGIKLDQGSDRGIAEKQVLSALHWQYAEYNYHVTADERLIRIIQDGDQEALNSADPTRVAALNQTVGELVDEIAKTHVRQ